MSPLLTGRAVTPTSISFSKVKNNTLNANLTIQPRNKTNWDAV
jgi:hypothetical protein